MLLFSFLCSLAVAVTPTSHHDTHLSPFALITRHTRLRASAGLKEGCGDFTEVEACYDADCYWSDKTSKCLDSSGYFGGDSDYVAYLSSYKKNEKYGKKYDNDEYLDGDKIKNKDDEYIDGEKIKNEDDESLDGAARVYDEAEDPEEEKKQEEEGIPSLPARFFRVTQLANKEFSATFKGKTKEQLEAVTHYPVLLLGAGFNGEVYVGSRDGYVKEVKDVLSQFNAENENLLIKVAKPNGEECLEQEVLFYPIAAKIPELAPWIPKYEGSIKLTRPDGTPKGFALALRYIPHSLPLDNFSVHRPNQAVLAQQWQHTAKSLILAIETLHTHDLQHDDLKPENVLVYSHGRELHVKIFDFGLAEFAGHSAPKVAGPLAAPQDEECYVYHSIENVKNLLGKLPQIYPKYSIWQSSVPKELEDALRDGLPAPDGRPLRSNTALVDQYCLAGLITWNLFWSKAPEAEYGRLDKEFYHHFAFLREMGIRAIKNQLKPAFLEWGVDAETAENLSNFIKTIVELKKTKKKDTWPIIRETAFYKSIIATARSDLPEGFAVPDGAKSRFVDEFLPAGAVSLITDSSQTWKFEKVWSGSAPAHAHHHKKRGL